MASSYTTPGVYFEQVSRPPSPGFTTGVPAFLGSTVARGAFASQFATSSVVALDRSAFAQLDASQGTTWADGYVPFAVRGFFQNGGSRCYVVAPGASYPASGLAAIDALDDIDLVCAPDLSLLDTSALVDGQVQLIDFCEGLGDFAGRPLGCFAILDSIGAPSLSSSVGVDVTGVQTHQRALVDELGDALMGASAALYGPWVKVDGAGYLPGPATQGAAAGFVPPCGHVAGVYASTDRTTGVFKSPANQALSGIQDLEIYLDDAAQALLDPMQGPGATSTGRRFNCVRAFPGRGSLVWGAGTLSASPTWGYVAVRRLTLTLWRWLSFAMTPLVFEPNDVTLWVRITNQVNTFLKSLYSAGAFQGSSPAEAYYVKCDAETNPPATRALGQVVTEVGIAPVRAGEFIVVRLVSSQGTATGPEAGG